MHDVHENKCYYYFLFSFNVSDDQALKEKSKSQIVNVMGKKMLFQNKVMKYPTDDLSRMYVGVMSVRPLDEVDPETLKKLGVEKEAKGTDKTHRETEDKIQVEEKRTKEKPILSSGVDKVPINLHEEMEELGFDFGRNSEAEVLKVEESKLEEKSEMGEDAVVAQATDITSKVTVMDKETKEDSIQDGDLKVVSEEHGSELKPEETNAKKLTDFETKKLQGVAGKKELGEAVIKKQETSTENEVKNEPESVSAEARSGKDLKDMKEGAVYEQETSTEHKVKKEHGQVLVEKRSENDSKAVQDSSLSKNKAVEASKEEDGDAKLFQSEDVARKDGEIIAKNEESAIIGNSHEMVPFSEAGDKKVKLENNPFDGSLEEKHLKVKVKF